MTEHAIRIRGLRKRYRGFTLRDVDLDVPRGFVTGLIGPNGAGKTTLIKLVMNLVRRDAGAISVSLSTRFWESREL
jgi:ABC-2 type transport system ATP-binding protein